MRLAFALALVVLVLGGCGKFIRHTTVKTTAGILELAQPSLQGEADYELARSAIPGALKTIEGFWIVDDNEKLVKILTEGYCQYGTAFVEDDWEEATFKKDLAAIEYHNARATHIFTRCLNYALHQLGSRWRKDLFAEPDKAAKLIRETGKGDRNAMMWAGLALGSIINHNLSRVEMLAYLPTVRQIIDRVLEIDAKGAPSNKVYAALPHIALGMILTATGKDFGGDAVKARTEFEKALEVTGGKMLLARTLMAFRVGKATNDRKFFHAQLKQVLETAPSVWPEQRLANEVAHRKARRYLSHEKELF
jgi:hypothetical protein